MQNEFKNLAAALSGSIPDFGQAFASWQDQFAEIGKRIDEQFKGLEASARQLGTAGWTIPMWAPPGLVPGLLAHTKSPSEIDASFTRMYTKNRGTQFRHMFERLERRRLIEPWLPLLEECRYAYSKRKFLVTVPALLAVIEGLVATAGNALQSRQTPRNTTIAKYKDSRGVKALAWASLDAFVDTVFRSRSFADSRPAVINRHWILHGRDSASWTQADSLRLFQAIDTLASIIDVKDAERAA